MSAFYPFLTSSFDAIADIKLTAMVARMRPAVLALLLLAGCDQTRTIPPKQDLREFNETHPVGHYQAVVKPDGSIWVLDTQTGYIQRCDTTANTNGQCALKPMRM